MSFILLGILNSQAAGGGAGGPAYDLLETTVLTSSASSVSFTGLGSYTDYKHLQIKMVAKGTFPSLGTSVRFRLNGDSGTNYANHTLRGTGSAVQSFGDTSRDYLFQTSVAGSAYSNDFGAAVIDFLDFSSNSKNTTARSISGLTNNPGETAQARIALQSGLWLDTSPVTSIELFTPNTTFVTGSRFSLYGIRA